jgi:hypothetical protein
MALLSQAFNESLSELRLEAYWIALNDCDIAALEMAAHNAMRTAKFFPRPAELRERFEGTGEDDAEKAWQLYKAEARRVGGYASPKLEAALAETLVLVFGSWESACWSDFSPEMWASKRKEFGRTYRILRQRGLSGEAQLTGFFDREGHPELAPARIHQLTDGDDDEVA